MNLRVVICDFVTAFDYGPGKAECNLMGGPPASYSVTLTLIERACKLHDNWITRTHQPRPRLGGVLSGGWCVRVCVCMAWIFIDLDQNAINPHVFRQRTNFEAHWKKNTQTLMQTHTTFQRARTHTSGTVVNFYHGSTSMVQ